MALKDYVEMSIPAMDVGSKLSLWLNYEQLEQITF